MSKHLRKLRIGGEETYVNEYSAGDNVTFTRQSDGVIRIDAAGGDASGGCMTYRLEWDSDQNAFVLRNSESATVAVEPITFKVLRVADGDEYIEFDTTTPAVRMSDGMKDALIEALKDLPVGYTKATVLSTSKNAYVDTGLTINGAYEITVIGCTASNAAAILFDAYDSNTSRQGGILYNRADPRYDRWWPGVAYARLETTGIDLAQMFTLIQNKDGVTIRQGAVESSASYSGTTATGTANILLGASQRTDLDPTYTAWDELIITLDGTTVKHYVGCIRDSDGVAGFYEKVEGVFKTSDGSSMFSTV